MPMAVTLAFVALASLFLSCFAAGPVSAPLPVLTSLPTPSLASNVLETLQGVLVGMEFRFHTTTTCLTHIAAKRPGRAHRTQLQ